VSGFGQRCSIASTACFHRAPAVRIEVVVASRVGQQQRHLAERVELELLVYPVADDVRAARVAGQL
jgi:hypothetical protein